MTDRPKELRLNFANLQKELESVPNLARPFLTPEGTYRLDEAKRQLSVFKSKPGQPVTWEVPRDAPIRTVLSKGQYERRDSGKQKGPHIHGALSFKWEMTTSEKAVKEILLCGKASTMICLCEGEGDEARVLSMWKMEIGVGAAASPGCFFHIQVPGTEEDPPFPESIPVPRLPVFPPTPMACLEFVLGELFQRDWMTHVDRAGT